VKALKCDLIVTGPQGNRTVAADDFFADIWTTVLDLDEILVEIRVPNPTSPHVGAYKKFRQRASDWAMVGVAIDLETVDGTFGNASVVMTNMGNVPIRASQVERVLAGQTITRDVVHSAAERAGEGTDPSSDLKASREYKLHLARVLTRRALETALDLA
ncbi:MAG: carbon monoxide dehydrogenase, partial [Chloroflexi bacterium]